MKNLLLAYLIIVIGGCGPSAEEKLRNGKDSDKLLMIIPLEKEGCEYIVYVGHNIIHKQNCKYCSIRSKHIGDTIK